MSLKITSQFIIGLFAAIAGSSPALANDSTAVMAAGGLKLEKSAELALRSEILRISPSAIKVDYEIENLSDKVIETIVAFPLPRLEGPMLANVPVDVADKSLENFVNFRTVVDGVEAKPKLQTKAFRIEENGTLAEDVTADISKAGILLSPLGEDFFDKINKPPQATIDKLMSSKLLYMESFDAEKHYTPLWAIEYTYYITQTFAPKKTVRIHHEYQPVLGRSFFGNFGFDDDLSAWCLDAPTTKALRSILKKKLAPENGSAYIERKQVDYVLKTGANWAGPIKNFELIVDKEKPTNIVSLCAEGLKKISPTEFRLTKKDFTPTTDLTILFFEA